MTVGRKVHKSWGAKPGLSKWVLKPMFLGFKNVVDSIPAAGIGGFVDKNPGSRDPTF